MIGIISDIHGNYPALAEVISEIRRRNIKDIICLGDICGYYPWVNECITLVKSLTENLVLGNHDFYILKNTKCPRSNSANNCLDYQRKIIDKKLLTWLSTKPYQAVYHGINCVHGGWNDYVDEYITAEILERLKIDEKFAVSGHSHIPEIKKVKSLLYCNPGSVGQPRDGNPKASFAIFDGNTFEIIRVAYDWTIVQKKMLDCGFDEYYTKNLEFGYGIGYSKKEPFKS